MSDEQQSKGADPFGQWMQFWQDSADTWQRAVGQTVAGPAAGGATPGGATPGMSAVSISS